MYLASVNGSAQIHVSLGNMNFPLKSTIPTTYANIHLHLNQLKTSVQYRYL